LSRTTTNSDSYVAIRVHPSTAAETWLAAARRRPNVPRAIAALIGGRNRVEVTAEEAEDALRWAASTDGWIEMDPKPLVVHDTAASLPV
jgi:hypothetical protein